MFWQGNWMRRHHAIIHYPYPIELLSWPPPLICTSSYSSVNVKQCKL